VVARSHVRRRLRPDTTLQKKWRRRSQKHTLANEIGVSLRLHLLLHLLLLLLQLLLLLLLLHLMLLLLLLLLLPLLSCQRRLTL
jgi:hypothetical protein